MKRRTPARRRRRAHHPPAAPLPTRTIRPDAKTSRLVEGTLDLKGRVGFVLSENPALSDVLIDGPSLRLALDGDRVRAEVLRSEPRRAGRIVEVLQRARTTIVGAFGRVHDKPVLVQEDSVQTIELLDLHGLHPGNGELAVARITRWPTEKVPAAGELVELLGPRSRPGVALEAVIRKHELPSDFPAEVQRQADAFGGAVDPAAYAGRKTYFDQRVFTIDGADAKDFDDAVSIARHPDGSYQLGVHIADVSHYVREGSALDQEALRRGTSVYLSGTVLPMLPFALSDGLCSLRPEQIRLTLTCEMTVRPDGTVASSRVFESAICSVRRFTYEQVELVLRGESLPGLSPDVAADVREMGRLARRIRQRRVERGSLDFDFPEAYVQTDPQGRPLDIRRRERLEAHRLIEDFMILANETVARFMSQGPFLYRVHEKPDPHKLEKLKTSLGAVGVSVPRGFESGSPKVLQGLLKSVEGKPYQPMIHMMVLRSLKQAVYSPTLTGHFGLASGCYTHFTSPIRRYPDLVVHRLVKEKLHHHFTAARQAHWKAALPGLARHTSARERAAVEAEREYMDVQKVRLMESHVGETFTGVVSSVTAFGLFVQLNEFFVEGLVHISNLKGDYYLYDEVRMLLRGKRSGRTFHMGQAVRVQLASANAVKRQLDFELL